MNYIKRSYLKIAVPPRKAAFNLLWVYISPIIWAGLRNHFLLDSLSLSYLNMGLLPLDNLQAICVSFPEETQATGLS